MAGTALALLAGVCAKTVDDRGAVEKLCDAILGYLRQNPNASDTLEGILEWWILERDIRRESDKVRQAIQSLVKDGTIEAHCGSDGQVRYRLRRGERDSKGAEA